MMFKTQLYKYLDAEGGLKMMKCQMYGLIYYYRKGERKLTAESDRELKRIQESQPSIQWPAVSFSSNERSLFGRTTIRSAVQGHYR